MSGKPLMIAARFRLWLLPALFGLGCGGAEGPELVRVKGTVTLDGKPLEDARITFIPDPGNPAVTPGGAHSASDGSYKAKYMGRPGLAPGKYRVTVDKAIFAGDASKVPKEILEDPEQLRLIGMTKQTLPPVYSDPVKTRFVIDVPADGGSYDFSLESTRR
jgi:hypothetical protein